MGYQHEHEKCPCKVCIPRANRVHYSACHFLVNWIERLIHPVLLPLSLFKLERKKACCYPDLSEPYLSTGHDFGE